MPITGLFSCRSSGAMLSRCPRPLGEVPERSNGAVSKTVVPLTGDRGFESLPLRQFTHNSLRYLICERFRLLLHKVPA